MDDTEDGTIRTVFVANDMVIYEDLPEESPKEISPHPKFLWWINVKFFHYESELPDAALIDIMIERVEESNYTFSLENYQKKRRLYVSFPIFDPDNVTDQYSVIINRLRSYKVNVKAGWMNIDSKYLFEYRLKVV